MLSNPVDRVAHLVPGCLNTQVLNKKQKMTWVGKKHPGASTPGCFYETIVYPGVTSGYPGAKN